MSLLALALLFAPSLPAALPELEVRPKAAIEEYLAACESYGWSGLVYAEKDGKVVVHAGYGMADRKARRKNGKGTLFEIASATKPITACAIMALVEDGKIALTDSIDKHLPGVPLDKRSITVEHLLSHTSGMPRMGASGTGDDMEAAVTTYLSAPMERKPGAAYEYWNGGYALLAAIVTKVSGSSYQDYCRTRLFERAGMKSSGFTGDEDIAEGRQAVGYSGGSPVRMAAEHPYGSYGYQYLGMGGVVSCAADLVRFTEAFDGGAILKPETAALMLNPSGASSGLGWRVSETTRGTRRIGHGGDVRGFHTQWQRFPDEDALVIVFSNCETGPPLHLAWNIESMLFGSKPIYPVPPAPGKITKSELRAAEGIYESSKGERITIESVGDHLSLSPVTVTDASTAEAASLSPPERKAWDNAKALLADVIAGEAEKVRPKIVDRVPSMWATTLTRSIWPKHAAQWGPLKATRCVSVRPSANDYWTILVQLDHEEGLRPLKMVLQGSQLSGFDLSTETEKIAGTYTWTQDDRFECFEWMPGPVKHLRFRGGKRQRKTLTVNAGFGGIITFRRVEE